MKPDDLVNRLIEGTEDGANLTSQEISTAYLNDYTGNLGLLKSVYLGPSSKSHQYLALMDGGEGDEEFYVTHLFVSKGSPSAGPEALQVEFSGDSVFSSKDRKAAEDYFNKEAHVKGGGKIKPAAKPTPPAPYGGGGGGNRARQAAAHARWNSGGGSPHWDGNRYAL